MVRRNGVLFLLAGWMYLSAIHPRKLAVEAANEVVIVEATAQDTSPREASPRSITIQGNQFILDGNPLHIISGSVHYFRQPSQYWRNTLRKLKAAGFNAVSSYVEWSFHEPEEGAYIFEGDHDVAQFVRLAAEEGLLVLLRPGPYICAERDLGGFPYWLLSKYPNIRLRTTDEDFMREVQKWFVKLFEQMTPLLYGNGGPIILVQVENEYGSYSSDMKYKTQLRDIVRAHVLDKALLYTTDGYYYSMIRKGAISETLTTVDFGVGHNVDNVFKDLRMYMPEGPLMNSEFYPGWLTHWGESLQQVDKDEVVKSLKDMIDKKINVNMYVFFGGTNFGFSAGANSISHTYAPDITSYDYDAPLNEAGDPTPKYYAIRQLMETYYPEIKNITPPSATPKANYGKVEVIPLVNLLSKEGRSRLGRQYGDVTASALPTFEQLRQNAGLVLYETTLGKAEGTLLIRRPRDRVYVYVDGDLKGIIDRMSKKYILLLQSKAGSRLSLLVENQGRINYGSELHDFKGILGEVKYNNQVLNGVWKITGYPLEEIKLNSSIENQPSTKSGPVLYQANVILPAEQVSDTYIDPTGWGKGYIWVNGHNLGRYWPARGPQVTLYMPGAWLRPSPQTNLLQILELERAHKELTLQFIDYPILNRTSEDSRLADPEALIFGV